MRYIVGNYILKKEIDLKCMGFLSILRREIVVISSKYVDGLDVHTSGVCAECLKFLLEGP